MIATDESGSDSDGGSSSSSFSSLGDRADCQLGGREDQQVAGEVSLSHLYRDGGLMIMH